MDDVIATQATRSIAETCWNHAVLRSQQRLKSVINVDWSLCIAGRQAIFSELDGCGLAALAFDVRKSLSGLLGLTIREGF